MRGQLAENLDMAVKPRSKDETRLRSRSRGAVRSDFRPDISSMSTWDADTHIVYKEGKVFPCEFQSVGVGVGVKGCLHP